VSSPPALGTPLPPRTVVHFIRVGEEEYRIDSAVVGMEVWDAPANVQSWVATFSVLDGGLELMGASWPELHHKFSI
jgi:hypothetical protein